MHLTETLLLPRLSKTRLFRSKSKDFRKEEKRKKESRTSWREVVLSLNMKARISMNQ
jgi:hypothetical protein